MKYICTYIFLFLTLVSYAQSSIGVAFHQSSIPFIGVNLELPDSRFRPEVRLGIDSDIENAPLEVTLNFDLVNKEAHEVYIGAGGRLIQLEGFVFPLGTNIYPFAEKQFGFHIELATLITTDERRIFRGSWGIRYRFK